MNSDIPESQKGLTISLGLNYLWLFEIQDPVGSSNTTISHVCGCQKEMDLIHKPKPESCLDFLVYILEEL